MKKKQSLKKFMALTVASVMMFGAMNWNTQTIVKADMPTPTTGDAWAGVNLDELITNGDGVYYGSYKHVANVAQTLGNVTSTTYEKETTPILWRTMGEDIIDGVKDSKIAFMSEYVLDFVPFHNKGVNAKGTGEYVDSSVRSFINGDFLKDFNSSEQSTMVENKVITRGYESSTGLEVTGLGTGITDDSRFIHEMPFENSGDKVYLPWQFWSMTTVGKNTTFVRTMHWSSDSKNDSPQVPGDETDIFTKYKSYTKGGSAASYFVSSPSPFNSQTVQFTAFDGGLSSGNITETQTKGIRPIFKLDPQSVVNMSEIKEATSNDNGDSVYALGKNSKKNYKLTVLGGKNGADVGTLVGMPTAEKAVASNGTLTIDGLSDSSNKGVANSLAYKLVNSNNEIVGSGVSSDLTKIVIDTTGLEIGELSVYVWLQKTNEINSDEASKPVSFGLEVVQLTTPDAPNPVDVTRTDTTLTFTPVDGNLYSIDDGVTWQAGGEFTGLTPNADYVLKSKVAAVEGVSNESAVTEQDLKTKVTIAPPTVDGAGGKITADKTYADIGEKVTYTLTSSSGYAASEIKVGGISSTTFVGNGNDKTFEYTVPSDLEVVNSVAKFGKLPANGKAFDPTIDTVAVGDKTITGTGQQGNGIIVNVGGVDYQTTVKGDGTWTLDLPEDVVLVKDEKVYATQTGNGLENSGRVETTIVDKTPIPTVDKIVEGAETVTGKGEVGNTIVVTFPDNKTAEVVIVNEDGTWTVDVPDGTELAEGNVVNVVQVDKDTNKPSTNVPVTVEKDETTVSVIKAENVTGVEVVDRALLTADGKAEAKTHEEFLAILALAKYELDTTKYTLLSDETALSGVDFAKVGTYGVKLIAEDNNKLFKSLTPLEKIFSIEIVDTTAPTITANATQSYALNAVVTWDDFLADVVIDAVDNYDATVDVLNTNADFGNVSFLTDATYTVTLGATDKNKNVATPSYVTVVVGAGGANIPPVVNPITVPPVVGEGRADVIVGGEATTGAGDTTTLTDAPIRSLLTNTGQNLTAQVSPQDPNLVNIFDEDGTALGSVNIPQGQTLDTMNIDDLLTPLGLAAPQTNKTNPKTGDNSAVPFAGMALLIGCAAIVMVRKIKITQN